MKCSAVNGIISDYSKCWLELMVTTFALLSQQFRLLFFSLVFSLVRWDEYSTVYVSPAVVSIMCCIKIKPQIRFTQKQKQKIRVCIFPFHFLVRVHNLCRNLMCNRFLHSQWNYLIRKLNLIICSFIGLLATILVRQGADALSVA